MSWILYYRYGFSSSSAPSCSADILITKTDHTDFGAQAVQQCSNQGGQYCCDHNRDENNVCCDQNDDSLFFSLPDGKPTASIAKLGTPAAATGGSNNNNNNFNNGNNQNDNNNNNNNKSPTLTFTEPTSTSITFSEPPSTSSTPDFQPQSSSSSTIPSFQTTTTPDIQNQNQIPNRPSSSITFTPSRKTTITRSSIASTNGLTSLVLLTSIITTAAAVPQTTLPSNPSANNNSTSPSVSKSSSPSAAIIGGAVGGGVAAVIVVSLGVFLCLRRRRNRKREELKDATVFRSRSYLADQKRELEWMYKGQEQGGTGKEEMRSDDGMTGGSPEIDGREVGGVGGGGGSSGVDGAAAFRGDGGRRPGEVTRVEGFASGGGEGRGAGGDHPPKDKWQAYELAADGR